MKKRSLLMAASLVLALLVATTGTMAYLSDTDSDVNVMTLGNVKIEQIEMQRVVKDGAWVSTGETDKYGYTPDKLEPFADLQPLYPAFFAEGSIKWDDRANGTHQQSWNQIGAPGANQLFDDSVMGVQDKFVFVKNTGSSDAYVRTWFAFEQGSFSFDAWEDTSKPTGVWTNTDGEHWTWETVASDVPIGDNTYVIQVATYVGPKNGTGNLAAGATTYPSLLQVYMRPEMTNEDIAAIDGDDNGRYDILVFSEAVQVTNFESVGAEVALNTAFGDPEDGYHPWSNYNDYFEWEGVLYETSGDPVTVSAGTGDTVYRGILSDRKITATEVVIGEGIVRLNNRAVCKAPTVASVSLPSTLTYIDESAFQESGIVSIEVPENVTYIGKQAFGSCSSLEKIVINAENVTIANYVARGCENLKEVYIYSDSVTFESGSMYFTNKESGDASGITFYVKDQAMADVVYSAFSTSHSYGLLIKSLDGATTYYNTLK